MKPDLRGLFGFLGLVVVLGVPFWVVMLLVGFSCSLVIGLTIFVNIFWAILVFSMLERQLQKEMEVSE